MDKDKRQKQIKDIEKKIENARTEERKDIYRKLLNVVLKKSKED